MTGELKHEAGMGPDGQREALSPLEIDRGVLLTLEDTTEALDFQRQLRRIARTDHLTQSLNRLGIEEEMRRILSDESDKGAYADDAAVQVLYFDLNDFKSINDEQGHAAGDAVLTSFAGTIRESIRPGDLAGRLGGDEFVAILRGATAREAEAVAERVNGALEDFLGLSSSVGFAAARPGDDFDSLVRRADRAMYRDKAGRRAAD